MVRVSTCSVKGKKDKGESEARLTEKKKKNTTHISLTEVVEQQYKDSRMQEMCKR